VAEVDLARVRQNVDVVARVVGPGVGILAVVKADAYGHGAVACARALERKVWGFAVSLVEEGVELRRAGVEAPIVVLGSFYGLSHRDVVAYRLTPVVSDAGDLPRFVRAAAELNAPRVGIHVKIDTGMARLGVRPEALPDFLTAVQATPEIELTGLCSHLADAEAEDPSPSERQLERFAAARARVAAAGFRPVVLHVANSAGARLPAARFDMVRPGLALYGVGPLPGLAPALSWKSRVVALRTLPSGTPVSYGGLHTTARESVIATVPVGYADGYTRRMTGRAEALVGGRRVRVVGAITMDMCMVDVTDAGARVGDEVVLLGQQGGQSITAEELAAWAGTIPYEVLCGISKRVPRVYAGERS
jgi:alanine racemase